VLRTLWPQRRGQNDNDEVSFDLLRPKSGHVRVFGIDPAKDEVAVKRRLAYVPDQSLSIRG